MTCHESGAPWHLLWGCTLGGFPWKRDHQAALNQFLGTPLPVSTRSLANSGLRWFWDGGIAIITLETR